MKIVKQYPDGIFNWLDLSTSDIRGAQAFYSQLFGWEVEYEPIGDAGVMSYTTFSLNGYTVAGGNEMPEEMKGNVPPAWSSTIKHGDVDAVVARAAEAGGAVLMPPADLMDQGRLAVIQDPTGAAFSVWQPGKHIGAQLVNQPNTLVWNELHTRNQAAASTFYQAVFGWKEHAGDSGYLMWTDDNGRFHCGSYLLEESSGDMPAHWLPYFLVDDVEATAARAVELGGSVITEPNGEGMRFAVLSDPQGAVFAVIRFGSAVDDPPGEVEEVG